MRLSEKTAIITGGGRGIGKAIALSFAKEGAQVVLVGRMEKNLREVEEEIGRIGGKALSFPTDVSDSLQVKNMVQETLKALSKIDILVNNAGIEGPTSPITEVSDEDWDEVLNINLRGTFLCSREVSRSMIERKSGNIILVSALGGGIRGYPFRIPYATTKGAQITFAKSLAVELAPHGICVNAITPGPVAGERLERVLAGRAKVLGKSLEEVREKLIQDIPLKRIVEEEEVAKAAVYLCSEEAKNITGISLNMTAGLDL